MNTWTVIGEYFISIDQVIKQNLVEDLNAIAEKNLLHTRVAIDDIEVKYLEGHDSGTDSKNLTHAIFYPGAIQVIIKRQGADIRKMIEELNEMYDL